MYEVNHQCRIFLICCVKTYKTFFFSPATVLKFGFFLNTASTLNNNTGIRFAYPVHCTLTMFSLKENIVFAGFLISKYIVFIHKVAAGCMQNQSLVNQYVMTYS